VLTRRAVLLAPAVLYGQRPRVGVNWIWLPGRELPYGVADSSIVFTRAYVADPRRDKFRLAATTGKFSHAVNPGDPTLESMLKDAGLPYTVNGRDVQPITVYAGAGDGDDSPAEQSIHMTLAIRYPAVLEPRVSSGIQISEVDLMPTIAALCGVVPPAEVQGRNLSALLRKESANVPDSVYVQGGYWRVVIRGYDKLVTDLTGAPEHLYNLAEDPHEETDLVNEQRGRLIRDALAALMQIWMRKLGDRIDPSGLKQR
jgi:hypothetical protein